MKEIKTAIVGGDPELLMRIFNDLIALGFPRDEWDHLTYENQVTKYVCIDPDKVVCRYSQSFGPYDITHVLTPENYAEVLKNIITTYKIN